MSSEYHMVKVSAKAAKVAKVIILSFSAVGLLICIVSAVFFAMGEMDIATITIIVGVGMIVLGILIYGFIVMISNIRTTMSKREMNTVAKRILILVPSSLLLLVLLVILLNL